MLSGPESIRSDDEEKGNFGCQKMMKNKEVKEDIDYY